MRVRLELDPKGFIKSLQVLDGAPATRSSTSMTRDREIPRQVAMKTAGYLEPMRAAGISADTELYVGLVHLADGIAGARARIATAQRVLERPFGIATECGLGRSLPDTVPAMLRMHAALAAPVAVV